MNGKHRWKKPKDTDESHMYLRNVLSRAKRMRGGALTVYSRIGKEQA